MPRLETRKEQLLSCIVREHMTTADTIASDALKTKYGLDVSPATVRNEMAALEKAGYLHQPHTSAGRVPTEKAYRYYTDYCMTEQNVSKDLRGLHETLSKVDTEEMETCLKHLAKELANKIEEGIFVGFSSESFYYTGLSYLFEQPEFESVDLVRQVSEIVDNLDRVVADLFERIEPGVHVFIGSDSPFGSQCSTILLRGSKQPLFGVLGPVRMNYDRNVAIMKGLERLLM